VIAIPALDLREGACVQLVGGDYAQERVRLPDPVEVARAWRDAGFTRLHVVDLDAATGRGSNLSVIAALLRGSGLDVQVGGGLRDDESIERVLSAGASRAVVGTRAVEDPAWLRAGAVRFPGRLVVALDARNGIVVTRGWAGTTTRRVEEALEQVAGLPLAGVLVTSVEREGRMQGPDLDLVGRVSARSEFPVHASGGIASLADLRALGDCGAAAAVLGMALYTGALDPRAVSQEFGR